LPHVGSEDPTIPGAGVSAVERSPTVAGAEFQSCVCEGAGHAFACDARPHVYVQDSAPTAWRRTHDFLDEHLPVAA
jgi:carboxymethylenebutenolidase